MTPEIDMEEELQEITLRELQQLTGLSRTYILVFVKQGVIFNSSRGRYLAPVDLIKRAKMYDVDLTTLYPSSFGRGETDTISRTLDTHTSFLRKGIKEFIGDFNIKKYVTKSKSEFANKVNDRIESPRKKPKVFMETVFTRITAEEKSVIEMRAKMQGISNSELIRKVLREYLN